METRPLICRAILYDKGLCHERVKERIIVIQECTDIFYRTQTLSKKVCIFKNVYMFIENTCPSNQSIFLNPQNLSIL